MSQPVHPPSTDPAPSGPSSSQPAPIPSLAVPEPIYTGVRTHSPEPEIAESPGVQTPSSSAERVAFADNTASSPIREPRPRNGTYASRRSGARPHYASMNEFPELGYRPLQSVHASAEHFSEKTVLRRTISYRLQPTLDAAEAERDKCARKAQLTGWSLNIAIGLQVLLGSLTTGLSAVASQGHIASSTVVLGGLSTLTASYLARTRGSNEPELSITRTKDLEQFLRESKAFLLDHGHKYGVDGVEGTVEEQKEKFELEARIEGYRRRFEDLLGNANGERKLASVASV